MRMALGLLVLVLTLAGCGSASSSGGATGAPVQNAPGGSAVPAASHRAASAAGSSADAAGLSALGPKVIKTAQVSLRVPHGTIERVIIEATHVAGDQGGYALSTDLSRESGYAELVMRVPAARFEHALASLATLSGVTVTAQTVTGQEVGQQFVDLTARARNLQSQEVVLRRLMNQAKTVSATIEVENQLADVQGQLDQIHGRLRYLANQTALSTITVDMHEHGVVAPGKPSTIGAAFRRGWNAALDVCAGLIVAVGFALPIALLVLLVLVIGWRLRPVAERLTNRPERPAAD